GESAVCWANPDETMRSAVATDIRMRMAGLAGFKSVGIVADPLLSRANLLQRMELLHLKLYDVDQKHGLVTVREGKGKRDRVVPIGERALAWVDLYLNKLRPEIVKKPDDGVVFLTSNGVPFT